MRARNFQVLCIDMASIAVCLHQIIPQNDLKEKNQKEIYLSVDPKIASSSWFGTLLEHGCNKVNRLERTDIILPIESHTRVSSLKYFLWPSYRSTSELEKYFNSISALIIQKPRAIILKSHAEPCPNCSASLRGMLLLCESDILCSFSAGSDHARLLDTYAISRHSLRSRCFSREHGTIFCKVQQNFVGIQQCRRRDFRKVTFNVCLHFESFLIFGLQTCRQ